MSKNSVTKKLITTLALLTCLCGIGTLSVHAAPKAVSFNNNSKKITMFTTQRKQLKVKLSGKYKHLVAYRGSLFFIKQKGSHCK